MAEDLPVEANTLQNRRASVETGPKRKREDKSVERPAEPIKTYVPCLSRGPNIQVTLIPNTNSEWRVGFQRNHFNSQSNFSQIYIMRPKSGNQKTVCIFFQSFFSGGEREREQDLIFFFREGEKKY